MQLDTLYHEGRGGAMYSWSIRAEGNVIITEHGLVDGEKTETRKEVEGKNIGRSNETTPQEQAEKEARAAWQKKLDRKYSLTPEEARETVFLPMLAHNWRKQKRYPEFPLDVQPKLDGVRCIAHRDNGKVKLMSRGGKEYDLPHVTGALDSIGQKYALDGELYAHGLSLQQINRLVKKHRPGETEQVQFVVFDIFRKEAPDMPWGKRRDALDIAETVLANGAIRFIQTETVHDEDELYAKLAEYEAAGYEGIIIRTHGGKYELGHRSRDLLKLKNFQDTEFEIVGYKEGSGADEGTVVWCCQTAAGNQFWCRPIGTIEERCSMYENAEAYLGQFLTVKFQAWTDDGLPQFPVGIAVRAQEDILSTVIKAHLQYSDL